MEEKAKKKMSKIDRSNLGSSFDLEPIKGKEKEHKEGKKKHATDKALSSGETLGENCTGGAADKQICSIEGNIDRKEESHVNKRNKRKGRNHMEGMNCNIADDKEMQFLGDNQQSKMKKTKNRHNSLAGMQETCFSKPSKRGKMTERSEFKNYEVDAPLDRISIRNANADSLVAEVHCQGKKMKKKNKKLSNKSERTVRDYKCNEAR